MRLLSGKSNTNSSVQQQKEDHSSFNSQLNGKNLLNNTLILSILSILVS